MTDHYFYFFAGKDELFGVDRADCVVVDIAVYAADRAGVSVQATQSVGNVLAT